MGQEVSKLRAVIRGSSSQMSRFSGEVAGGEDGHRRGSGKQGVAVNK